MLFGQAADDGVGLLIETCPDGWWYTAALPDNRRIVAAMSDADLVRALDLNRLDGFMRALGATQHLRGALADARPIGLPALRPAGSRHIIRDTSLPLLCVGDAASCFDPVSGQGLFKALRSGIFVAYAIGDLLLRADDSGVARVVVRRLLLPVTRLVFFVDYDQSEFSYRSENSGARADHDARVAILDSCPLVESLTFLQGRVKDRDLITKLSAESTREDRCQCDLGYKHHRRPAEIQRAAHCANVDFGFAAARDAMQEKRRVGSAGDLPFDHFQHCALCRRQGECFTFEIRSVGQWIATHCFVVDFDELFFRERGDR